MGERHRLFVIAKAGSHYRSLAVVHHERLSGHTAVQQCALLLRIFSHPENRVAIQQELRNAKDYFGDKPPPPTDSGSIFCTPEWAGRPYPFPYIGLCLLHGSSNPREDDRDSNIHVEAFNRGFDEGEDVAAITVIDITDLDNVKYCFVNLVSPAEQPWFDLDEMKDDSEGQLAALLHNPLSAGRYLGAGFRNAFNPGSYYRKLIDNLTSKPLVSIATLANAWPWGDWACHGPIAPLVDKSPPCGPEGLVEKSIAAVVAGVLEAADYSQFETAMEQFGKLPHIDVRPVVRSALVKHSAKVVNTRPSVALLAWAYDGEEVLDWSPFVNLTAAAVRFAMENLHPKCITSINLSGTVAYQAPEDLWSSLADATSLKSVYLLEPPIRPDDTTGILVFNALVRSNIRLPLEKLVFSGLVSYGLEERAWSTDYRRATNIYPAFPITQLLVDSSASHFSGLSLQLEHFFLGDAFLTPTRFVTGLLRYLVNVENTNISEGLFGKNFVGTSTMLSASIAGASSSLTELEPGEVGIFPAQVRELAGISARTSRFRTYYSNMRDLIPGQWTVLLKLIHRAAFSPTSASYQIVFLRPKVRIGVPDPTSTAPVSINEDDFDVYGLQEFLRETSPGTNLDLVDAFIEALVKASDHRNTPRLAPMENNKEIFTMLKTCMENAHEVRHAQHRRFRW